MLPLMLALYDKNNLQYTFRLDRNEAERLRFTKSFYGGMDVEMSFFLPCSLNVDYPYIGYGQKAELWYGLTRIFLTEQREIEESKEGDTEGINVRCVGYRVFLDDYCYGGKGKLWVDTRYEKWKETTSKEVSTRNPERYRMDMQNRLFIAPVKNENFGNTDNFGQLGALWHYGNVKRVTFDYNIDLQASNGNWIARLRASDADWGWHELLWDKSGVTESGSEDITLTPARPRLLFYLYWPNAAADYPNTTGEGVWIQITNLKVYGSTDTSPTVSDVAKDIVDQLHTITLIDDDKSLIEDITLTLEPLVFENGEKCLDALKAAAGYGDENYRLIGWGVESGGDRVFVRKPDYASVRYVIGPEDARRISRRGLTHQDFMTDGCGKYTDEEGEEQYTSWYYVHRKKDGLEIGPSYGDTLASEVYNVQRSGVKMLGTASVGLAAEAMQRYLLEHGHPQIQSSVEILGPVKDLHRGGAEIMPFEIEPGYLVQIPWFRAVEAEGSGDIRDWGTTFMLTGIEYNHDSGTTRLIPENDKESMERMLAYASLMRREEAPGPPEHYPYQW